MNWQFINSLNSFPMPPVTRLVGYVMATESDSHGVVSMSVADISHKVDIGRRSVLRAITKLAELRLIQADKTKGKKTVYTLSTGAIHLTGIRDVDGCHGGTTTYQSGAMVAPLNRNIDQNVTKSGAMVAPPLGNSRAVFKPPIYNNAYTTDQLDTENTMRGITDTLKRSITPGLIPAITKAQCADQVLQTKRQPPSRIGVFGTKLYQANRWHDL